MVQAPSLKSQLLTPQPAAADAQAPAAPAEQAPAAEVGAKPTPVTTQEVAKKDGFAVPAQLNANQPALAGPDQGIAALLKDTKNVGTPLWNVDVARHLTANGKVHTLSFGEKASLFETVWKVLPSRGPDPAKPTEGMSDTQLAAYNALSPQDRARYDQLNKEAAGHYQFGPFEGMVASPRSSVDELRGLLDRGELGSFFKVEDALGGAHGSQAKTDLHEALFRGALGKKGDTAGKGSTLSYLAQLSDPKTALLPNLNRQDFVAQVLHDVAHPMEIQQGQGNYYCGATSAASYFAMTMPTEYVRELAGLATKGTVSLDPIASKISHLFGGKIAIQKKDGGNNLTFNGQVDPNSKTPLTSQLFGGAFTDDAKKPDDTKPPTTGPTTIKPPGTGTGKDTQGAKGTFLGIDFARLFRGNGVNGIELAREINKRPGPKWDSLQMPPSWARSVSPEQRAEARRTAEAVLQTASAVTPVMVNVGGHWVNVIQYDAQTGKVQYYDPNQQLEEGAQPTIQTMTADELFSKASDLVYLKDRVSGAGVTVPSSMHNASWSKNGGGGPKSTGAGSGGGN